jgi:hypothetical protein
MYREFKNLDIECWLHSGPRIGVADRAIHLQAGPAACEILLHAINELSAAGPPAKRTLGLKISQRSKRCTTIRLRLSPESDELREMSFSREGEIAIFEFTPRGLDEFKQAAVFWQKGGEDFSVHPRGRKKELGAKDLSSAEVWFWTPFMDP